MEGSRAGMKIDRKRSANGQTVLANPQAVTDDVEEELRVVYGFNTKAASGCLADIMISQSKGEFPPVAFMLITKKNRHQPVEALIDRLEKAQKVFKHLAVIVVDKYPKLQEFQMLHLRRHIRVRIYTASTSTSAAKLMVEVRAKHALHLAEKARNLYKQLGADLLTREHALSMLRFNMPFLSPDECEMLLDVFGSFRDLSQVTADQILDNTVLNADTAQAVEEFFKTEYVVE